MSIYNLEKIFDPSSVAVIGAGERQNTIGCSLVENLIGAHYQGKVIPVNPRYKSIKGLTAYPSVLDIEGPVDLAIIATPITTVPCIVKECVQAGIGGAIIISAGGKEIGTKGKKLEAEIKKQADRGNLRIIGPNCMGIISVESKTECQLRQVNAFPRKTRLHFPERSYLLVYS